jgi:hypothetical protein
LRYGRGLGLFIVLLIFIFLVIGAPHLCICKLLGPYPNPQQI